MGYDVLHMHGHPHTHQDGTSHDHPHMHAHEHHDHHGDPNHSHPHTHVHDHSHEYRSAAPDLSRTQEPQPRFAEPGTPAPASAPVQQGDQTLVGVPPRADDAAATRVTPPTAPAAPAAPTDAAPVQPLDIGDGAAGQMRGAQQADEERAGARVSAATRDKLHSAILNNLDACDCDTCRDARDLFDPQDDDDEGEEGEDEDEGAEGAEGEERATLQQRARRSRRVQRILVARETRAVVQAQLAAALAPLTAQFRAIAAQLATVDQTQQTRAAGAEITTAISETRSVWTEALDLMRQIAAQPQPGGPVLKGSRAVMDRDGGTDASTSRSANGQTAVANAILTLREAGILRSDTIPQESQIAAAQAMIAEQQRRALGGS